MKLDLNIRCRWFARSTVFAVFFAITSYLLARSSLLTPVWVASITAIQTLVVGRAVAEDFRKSDPKG